MQKRTPKRPPMISATQVYLPARVRRRIDRMKRSGNTLSREIEALLRALRRDERRLLKQGRLKRSTLS